MSSKPSKSINAEVYNLALGPHLDIFSNINTYLYCT